MVASFSLISELGMDVESTGGGTARGRATVSPYLCQPGTNQLRISVMATWADILTGMAAGNAIYPRIPLTVDLEIHVLGTAGAGVELMLEAETIKVGRTLTLCRARISDVGLGSTIAVSYASFIASPNPAHVITEDFPKPPPSIAPLSRPLADRLECRVLAPGAIEMPRLADGQNAVGAVQGGLVAFAAEEAALSLADAGDVVVALNVRYLRPFMIGPVRTCGHREGALTTIELTDVGSGKLGATATARTSSGAAD
jgi:acyl-coenzyme A thioesterase PaaI-like protein